MQSRHQQQLDSAQAALVQAEAKVQYERFSLCYGKMGHDQACVSRLLWATTEGPCLPSMVPSQLPVRSVVCGASFVCGAGCCRRGRWTVGP
jgi:hypothetical protein